MQVLGKFIINWSTSISFISPHTRSMLFFISLLTLAYTVYTSISIHSANSPLPPLAAYKFLIGMKATCGALCLLNHISFLFSL